MRIKFLLSCSVILLIIITSIYSNASQNKEVKGVQTIKKAANVTSPSPTAIVTPTSSSTVNSNVQTVKKETEKSHGGWYWNSELNKSQRWMGKGSQGNDIWSDQGDAPPTSQSNTVANSSVSNNSPTLPPSELGATLAPYQYNTGAQQAMVGTVISSQNRVCYRDGREPKCP